MKLYRIIADVHNKYFRPQAWSLRTGWYNISEVSKSSREDAMEFIKKHSDRRLKRKVWIGLK
jgi:hypothetical protein